MKRVIPLMTLGLWLAGMTALPAAAEQSQVMRLEEVPLVARRAITTQVGNGKLGDIERVTDDGQISYEVDMNKDGADRSFSISPEGKLLSWQVFMRELPEPLKKAIHRVVGKGRLKEVYRVFDGGEISYDVEMMKGGKELSFSISPGGKLLQLEVEMSQTPEAVQKAIRSRAAGGTIKRVAKNTEEDEATYDVEIERAGTSVLLVFDAEGNKVDLD